MLSRRVAIIATLALGALAAAIALGSSESQRPAQTPAPGATTTAAAAQGDAPERGDGPLATPQAAALAGAPLPTARRFMAAWLNRTSDTRELRRQRPLLVGLTTGGFAQLVQVTIDDAIATGDVGAENQGQLVDANQVTSRRSADATVLLVARERQISNGSPLEPYRYTIYLAQLERTSSGGYALSALEPQS